MCRSFATYTSGKHLMPIQPILYRLVLLFATALSIYLLPTKARSGEVLVFLQSTADATVPAEQPFITDVLPELERFAKEQGHSVDRIAALKEAPEEVHITPLIVFQNHQGRSIYQGRLNTLDRIENFLRTATFVPQNKAALKRENLPVWKMGRATIASPIKISAVTGNVPKDYKHETFEAEARDAIEAGLSSSSMQATVSLRRSDRQFYMDFYPWRSRLGTCYLSLALFSQFHCKEPVFKTEEPLKASWGKRNSLFTEGVKLLEAEVMKQLTNHVGDAFAPLAESVPVKSWEAIGHPLPKPPSGQSAQATSTLSIPSQWVVESLPSAQPPPIVFRFPAPLDQYIGQVTSVSGNISLGADLSLSSLTGKLVADPTKVSMGESDLDDALQGSSFLKTKAFPESSFTITGSESSDKLAFGQLSTTVLSGEFLLKGKRVPLSAPCQLEPVVNQAGEVRLQLRGSFSIDVRAFEIDPADGPEPASHTLNFDVFYSLKPAEKN